MGVLIRDGASENTVGPENKIQHHVYDGVLVLGHGTDKNKIINNSAAYNGEISHNGRGISVINEYPSPSTNYDFQLGSPTSGPAGTVISGNDVVNNNDDGILLRYIAPRSGGVTTISDNQITGNGATGAEVGNGILCIGSSPDITDNTLTKNHENGIKLEVYFGTDDSPSSSNDNVLSDGPSMDIGGNTIGGSGTVIPGNYIGAGIYAVDTPLGDIASLYSANTWSADDDVCHIQQDWYGYVKVVEQGGNGVPGLTVVVEQGDDAAGWGWTYTFTTYDSAGNYGPTGFDVNHERTYQKIVEKRVTNDGTAQSFTPQLVYTEGKECQGEYAYDGHYDPKSESGGAIESPSGSGWDRYQYAQLARLSAGAPQIVAPKRVELAVDIDGNGVPSPGDSLRYTIEIENAGTADAEGVVFTDTPDPNTTLATGTVTTTQGTVVRGNNPGDTSIEVDIGTIPPGGTVTITFEVQINADVPPGTIIANQGLVSGNNFVDRLTDDPSTPAPDDPTETTVEASQLVCIVDPPDGAVYLGDVNEDGVVALEDAYLAAQFALGKISLTPRQQMLADVVEPRPRVDIRDATAIAEMALGIEPLCAPVYLNSDPRLRGPIRLERPPTQEMGLRLRLRPEVPQLAVGDASIVWIEASRRIAGLQLGPEAPLRFDPQALQVERVVTAEGVRLLASRIDNRTGSVSILALADRPQRGRVIGLVVRALSSGSGKVELHCDGGRLLDRHGRSLRALPTATALAIVAPLAVTLTPEGTVLAVRVGGAGIEIEAVRFRVYDLTGREVFDSGWQAGATSEWKLTDREDRPVANGVYLYRVEVEGSRGGRSARLGKLVIVR